MELKFIDLFAGMGGFRMGFEAAAREMQINTKCVFTSEIKKHAILTYQANFQDAHSCNIDITKIDAKDIPDFDVLLAGFPCQAFSYAGNRHGFGDTRGTLFFEIERILKEKSPTAFVLENVEGLIHHDKERKCDSIGKTMTVILDSLESLGYHVSWKVVSGIQCGVPQNRKRLFIVGHKKSLVNIQSPLINPDSKLQNIMEKGLPAVDNRFTSLLLKHYSHQSLYGKSITDKRGGDNNINSWDIGLKGEISVQQKEVMHSIMRNRRHKKWAENKGIKWMDGMPLTLQEISSFCSFVDLEEMLEDLVKKGYLKKEHPKDIVLTKSESGRLIQKREYRIDLEQGYNIVTGKLSFFINKILDPQTYAPTLVATDLDKIGVIDELGIRKLSLTEKKRLFGFPESFVIPVSDALSNDLFGNTVIVDVVKTVCLDLLKVIAEEREAD